MVQQVSELTSAPLVQPGKLSGRISLGREMAVIQVLVRL